MVINDRIFNNINKIMIDNNITGKELALSSGLSEAQISNIKHGKKIPNQFTILQICKGLSNMGIELDTYDVFVLNHSNVNFM